MFHKEPLKSLEITHCTKGSLQWMILQILHTTKKKVILRTGDRKVLWGSQKGSFKTPFETFIFKCANSVSCSVPLETTITVRNRFSYTQSAQNFGISTMALVN